jgi:hypothetical protein
MMRDFVVQFAVGFLGDRDVPDGDRGRSLSAADTMSGMHVLPTSSNLKLMRRHMLPRIVRWLPERTS